MTALSEFDIIKKLVEKPTKIDPSFGNLNLQFIRLDATGADEDEKPGDEEGSLEDTKKKVIRLSYSVWSALTKYLRNVVSYKQIALEIPGFAIFGPIIEKKGRDPMDKGLKNSNVMMPQPVFVVINDDWLDALGEHVQCDS